MCYFFLFFSFKKVRPLFLFDIKFTDHIIALFSANNAGPVSEVPPIRNPLFSGTFPFFFSHFFNSLFDFAIY